MRESLKNVNFCYFLLVCYKVALERIINIYIVPRLLDIANNDNCCLRNADCECDFLCAHTDTQSTQLSCYELLQINLFKLLNLIIHNRATLNSRARHTLSKI